MNVNNYKYNFNLSIPFLKVCYSMQNYFLKLGEYTIILSQKGVPYKRGSYVPTSKT